ncbi:RdgB/HAM1 family non-canonical purine NTP pyrophosphatase [Oscillospiraceae bacterium LTW-04]|nr:RdgB/HAM1 family non-canonical purine NTP pyrophosphatase [Oscillospiraceae bacterium MB24-C1]
MSKTLVAATHNIGKLAEFARMLKPKGVDVISPENPELVKSIVEDGETFADNALIKARAVFAATGLPTMADDSGLCIDALDGRPGVYSARYLGEDTPYAIKNATIIKELDGVPDSNRTARFECAIALVTAQGEHVFKGTFEGKIGYKPSGENGFGYDPIFYVGDESSADMSNAEKDAVSHRGKALRAMLAEIDKLL